MAAIENRIVIGNDQDNPIFDFQNDRIMTVNADTSVSLVGEELYIDQFATEVDYYVWIPYVFKPTDYDGFMGSDSVLLCTKMNYDIRLLPYGTKIVHYMEGNIAGVFYVQKVERTGKEFYKISAISAIGLMDKQPHKGGIYTGQYLQDVIEDIIGNDYNYIIDGQVAVQRVYGWLPYATKRENLYQILLAYGVEIVTGDNGALFFTFPDDEVTYNIPADRVYSGGKVIYDEPASRIEVSEHSYHYDGSVAEVQLFDNSGDETVVDSLVVFDQPIYPSSIRCSSGSLTISESHTNYAIVSGSGILSGKPYVHNIRLVTKSNASAPVEKVVSVKEATLITFVTADSVLNRLAEFYFNAQRVEQGILLETEKPGHKYTTRNAFDELITGYISRMQKSITSVAKANCRFIQNYSPTGSGQTYTNRLLVPLGKNATYTWTIPSEVFDKETPNIRITLIGKGQNGANGGNGATGKSSSQNNGKGKGGAGGAGGNGGLGGNILTVTILATGLTQLNFANSGVNSVMTSTYYNYTSADGAPNTYGYFDILTGETYAMPGANGTKGGNGGDGDYYTHTTGEASTATAGQNVIYNGVTYKGGAAGDRAIIGGGSLGISANITVYFSAPAGGGAAVGNNGQAGRTYRAVVGFKDCGAGDGANAIAPPNPSGYGTGGNGGHGGGGGGAGSNWEYWNHEYSSVIGNESHASGKGGTGSAGTAGNYGCAIIYW